MWLSIPLTLFWFFYMGSLGIFFPYFSLYLKENAGLSGTELGWILAVVPLVSIVAQPLWGQIADRTGARSHIVAFLSLGSAFGYLWLASATGFVAILFATSALAIFNAAILPITISVSLATLRNAGLHAFGFVRVWGTIGYFLLVLIFPSILTHYQAAIGMAKQSGGVSEPGLEIMFVATAGLVLFSAALGLFLPRGGAVSLRARPGEWKSLLKSKAYLRFLTFSFGAYFLSHGPMWLFPILVRARGGNVETIRGMWIYMLVFEIPLILATGSGLKRLGPRGLLGVGVFVGGLRWILCAGIADLQLLSIVQVLHGVTVVGLLMGGPLYLDIIAPEKLRSTAQAILSMVGIGIAGIMSNVGSGWLLDHSGVDILYLTSGLGSILLGALVWWILPSPQQSFRNCIEQSTRAKNGERFFAPDTMVWKVDREMVLLLAGGRALLMQLAHPKVAAGVAEHSHFKEDPLGRLYRTMNIMWSIVFDDTADARVALEKVKNTHKKVHGRTQPAEPLPPETPYAASDAELLLWVHATLIDSAMMAYEFFVKPLTPEEKSRYYDDTKKMADLFDIPERLVPTSLSDFECYMKQMLVGGIIAVGPIARSLSEQILHPRPLILKPATPLICLITTGFLPEPLRNSYGLRWNERNEKAFRRFTNMVRALLPIVPAPLRIVPNARRAEKKIFWHRGD